MATPSQAARELAGLSHDARRRRTAAVRRLLDAYRATLSARDATADDIDLLHRLAGELEEESATIDERQAAAAIPAGGAAV